MKPAVAAALEEAGIDESAALVAAKRPKARSGKKENKGYALGRLPPGVMNKTETSYSLILEEMKRKGEIVWFEFEPVKLRLAKNTFYTPDFLVMRADGTLEFHEVKGWWEEDARVKIKVAAEKYPIFLFIAIMPDDKSATGWKKERFGW